MITPLEIVEEKHLADNTKICYTYDNLSRVTNRTIKNECDCVISSENFTYDAFGIAVDDPILIPIGGALLGSG